MTETLRRMFRYVVPDDGLAHVIPLTSRPSAVGVTGGAHGQPLSVEFWAEHLEGAPEAMLAFRVFGTGELVPDGAGHVGTCPRMGEGMVLHLYEIPLPKEAEQ